MSKQEAEGGYVPSEYSRAYNNYSRNEIKSVIPILKSVARSCNIAFRYPVFKVLKAIAKIFLLNEIEGIFFAYMIRETNWDIKDRLISLNSQHVRDVVCCATDHPEYKNLILYLMLISYSLKYFLNDQYDYLLEEANRICPGFKAIFQNWAKKHSDLTRRINPKTLNKVHIQLTTRIRHQEPDFNLLVDSTLHISPAYNPEKDRERKEKHQEHRKQQLKREHQVKEEQFSRQQPTKIIKAENKESLEGTPLFSSSRIYEMTGGGVGLNVSEGSNFQVFGQLNKSGGNPASSKFGGSVFGSSCMMAMPSNPVKDEEDYCEELNLGLQEGLSEENINLRDPMPLAPPTSIINLSRGLSFHEPQDFKIESSDHHP